MTNLPKTLFVLLSLFAAPQVFAQDADDCKQLLESVRIPADGKNVLSENTLEARVFYKLVARGTFEKEDIGLGDSQYGFNKRGDLIITRCQNSQTGLLFGIALDYEGKGSMMPEWGKFNVKHLYTYEIPGREHKIDFHYQDCRAIGNKGSLMVDIYKCNRREKIK